MNKSTELKLRKLIKESYLGIITNKKLQEDDMDTDVNPNESDFLYNKHIMMLTRIVKAMNKNISQYELNRLKDIISTLCIFAEKTPDKLKKIETTIESLQ